jgi:ABC-2 type transport system ATP-binding protein
LLDIEQYLAAVREAGVAVEDVEIRRADLEDVFLDVMNTARADEASSDGPPQGARAPSGGSAAHEVASVGVSAP